MEERDRIKELEEKVESLQRVKGALLDFLAMDEIANEIRERAEEAARYAEEYEAKPPVEVRMSYPALLEGFEVDAKVLIVRAKDGEGGYRYSINSEPKLSKYEIGGVIEAALHTISRLIIESTVLAELSQTDESGKLTAFFPSWEKDEDRSG